MDRTELFTWTCIRCCDMTEGFEMKEIIVDVQNQLQAYVGVSPDPHAILIVFRGTQKISERGGERSYGISYGKEDSERLRERQRAPFLQSAEEIFTQDKIEREKHSVRKIEVESKRMKEELHLRMYKQIFGDATDLESKSNDEREVGLQIKDQIFGENTETQIERERDLDPSAPALKSKQITPIKVKLPINKSNERERDLNPSETTQQMKAPTAPALKPKLAIKFKVKKPIHKLNTNTSVENQADRKVPLVPEPVPVKPNVEKERLGIEKGKEKESVPVSPVKSIADVATGSADVVAGERLLSREINPNDLPDKFDCSMQTYLATKNSYILSLPGVAKALVAGPSGRTQQINKSSVLSRSPTDVNPKQKVLRCEQNLKAKGKKPIERINDPKSIPNLPIKRSHDQERLESDLCLKRRKLGETRAGTSKEQPPLVPKPRSILAINETSKLVLDVSSEPFKKEKSFSHATTSSSAKVAEPRKSSFPAVQSVACTDVANPDTSRQPRKPDTAPKPTGLENSAPFIMMKEARDLKHLASRIMGEGKVMESTHLHFEAAIKFLHAASMWENLGDVNQSMQLYSETAKFCQYCAKYYERINEMAGAALAYKCAEVAYMKAAFYRRPDVMRDGHELQTSLSQQMLSRLLTYTNDMGEAFEATRKSNMCLELEERAAAAVLVKEALNQHFHNMNAVLHLVRRALEAVGL